MEKVNQRLNIFTFTSILITAVFVFNACSKEVPDNEFTFFNTLDGANATPSNTEIGTGTCNAAYDSISNELAFTITWKDLTGTPTAINFQAPVTGTQDFKNIPVTESLSNNGVSGYLTIDQQDEAALINNGFYVNVGTASHSDGEIRGQLTKIQ